jgi:hypothetical protein
VNRRLACAEIHTSERSRAGLPSAVWARMLSYALGNRFKAFLAGVGVTSILQSSTATGLMVTAFAAGGLVDLVPALAVMLGANVGTTLIVQVLSFDVSRVSFLLILHRPERRAAGRDRRARYVSRRPRSHQRDLCGNWQALAKAADRHHRVEAAGVNRTPLRCITSRKPVHEADGQKSDQSLIFNRRSARCTASIVSLVAYDLSVCIL